MTQPAATGLADLYARLGDRERTLFWLKNAMDLHEDEPLLMLTHLFDFLRRGEASGIVAVRVGRGSDSLALTGNSKPKRLGKRLRSVQCRWFRGSTDGAL